MKVEFKKIFPAEIVSVQGKPYMFTNFRIERNTIPSNLYAYDVGDDCDGQFWRIQKFIIVNHWGTIVGLDQIDLKDGAYYCSPDESDPTFSSEGWHFGEFVFSLDEFVEHIDELREGANG